MRLSPPPKVVSPPGSRTDRRGAEFPAHRTPDRGTPHRGAGYWITIAVFAVLVAVAIGVFVVLPDWVASRPTTTSAPEAAGARPERAERVERVPAGRPNDEAPEATRDPKPELTGQMVPPPEPIAEAPPYPPEPAPQRADQPAPPVEPASVPASRSPEPATPSGFSRAIAAGLAALDAGDLDGARQAFESAASISPGSTEATDGLSRVAAAEQLETIAEHRRRAGVFEAEEDWGRAKAEYAAVLALDPAIRFAQEGEARASERESATRALDEYLSRSDRLSTEAVLEEARDAVERARQIADPGPALTDRISRLEREIEIAATPVRVVLISDGLTEVLVYRVGRLGRFERRELDLRPGTYTVVGARQGYRDVRHQLRVAADGSTTPLTVLCEEEV